MAAMEIHCWFPWIISTTGESIAVVVWWVWHYGSTPLWTPWQWCTITFLYFKSFCFAVWKMISRPLGRPPISWCAWKLLKSFRPYGPYGWRPKPNLLTGQCIPMTRLCFVFDFGEALLSMIWMGFPAPFAGCWRQHFQPQHCLMLALAKVKGWSRQCAHVTQHWVSNDDLKATGQAAPQCSHDCSKSSSTSSFYLLIWNKLVVGSPAAYVPATFHVPTLKTTVDGRNPTPVGRWFIPL